MQIQRSAGVTLIELLIVIAMLSIFSAGSLMFIMIPLREQAWSSTEGAYQSGIASTFSRLTEDMHEADRVEITKPDELKIWMRASGKLAEYRIQNGKLQRIFSSPQDATTTAVALLAEDVRSFHVERDPGSNITTIQLEQGRPQYDRTISRKASISLISGNTWQNGKGVQP